MFGAPQMSHDDRYDSAVEWLEIIKRLWTEDGEVNFDGRYYQVKGAVLAPKPLQAIKVHFMAGWGGFPLIGTREQVVEGLGMLAKAGFDGVLLSWPRYISDMRAFRDRTYPLLQQAGLR